jgi:hypothetical protein
MLLKQLCGRIPRLHDRQQADEASIWLSDKNGYALKPVPRSGYDDNVRRSFEAPEVGTPQQESPFAQTKLSERSEFVEGSGGITALFVSQQPRKAIRAVAQDRLSASDSNVARGINTMTAVFFTTGSRSVEEMEKRQ